MIGAFLPRRCRQGARLPVERLATALLAVAGLLATADLAPGAARAATARVAGVPARAQASTVLASPTLRLHLAVALRPRDPGALAAEVRAVSTPGSARYGRYLTPRQFGVRYGAAPASIRAVRSALSARGLHPGPTSAGGLSIPVTADVATISRALQVSLARVRHGSRTALVATDAPVLPASVAGDMQAVVGLDTAAHPHALALRGSDAASAAGGGTGGGGGTRRGRSAHARLHTTAPGPQACPTAAADATADTAYTDTEIAAAYGFDGLYAAGDEGQGTTIAVYELEPDDPGDIAAFQQCYGTHASVSYVHVDGGVGQGAGSDEAAFDIENVIGFAPRAKLLVYQGPNSNSGAPGSGPYDVFNAIVNQDRAQVVTVSWGECESILGSSSAHAEQDLFSQAAVQGQTFVAAAGDSGSEDCETPGAPTDLNLAVDDPSSQPDVLGVGGTTLTSLDPLVESVWNNLPTVPTGDLVAGAGGGGVSSFWAMPADQRDAAASLHVLSPAASGSACDRLSGYCREAPDVSADANPDTPYLIYWNGADTVAEPSGWQGLGGTSGAAPLWAALIALADSDPACDKLPIGMAGPALYAAAGTDEAGLFHDITVGNNDMTGTNGDRWSAGPGYDMASGLGTPDATPLVAALCADSVRLPAPAAQASAAGADVQVALRAQTPRGAQVHFAASHLPPGVRVDAATGALSGRPSKPGIYDVTAEAITGDGGRASARFRWSVGGSPHVTEAHLRTGRSPQLTVAIQAGRHVPAIDALRLTLPQSLRAVSTRSITVDSGKASVSATVRVHNRVVTITTANAHHRLTLTLGSRALRDAPGTSRRVLVAVSAGTTGTSHLQHQLVSVAR